MRNLRKELKMSRLLDRALLFNALSDAHDVGKVFEIINSFPTVETGRKTLKEFLETLEPEQVVYIGTEGGGGFMFCSPASKFKDDAEKIDKDNIEKLKFLINKAHRVRRIVGDKITFLKKVANDESSTKDGRLKAINRELPRLEDNIVVLCNSLSKLYNFEKSLENYIPLGDREVVESYERLQKDGLVVMVEGVENGSYWFVEEYLSGIIDRTTEEESDETN